jgi:hypothetical protein
MPELYSYNYDGQRYDIIKENIKDSSYGFSAGTLLSGNYPDEVDKILRYITEVIRRDYPKGDLSIFGRIKVSQINQIVELN